MTVSTINSVAEFVTNGATKNFPFYFKFLDSRDLVVTYIDPDGTSTVLNMGTQYTVSGAGNDRGGSIATTSALPGAGQLIVSRDMEAYQQTSLRNQGKFLAETHEDVFDRLTMLVQQGFAIFKRALTRPFGRDYFYAEGRRITDVANPKNAQDASTKSYADGGVAGSISYVDLQMLRTIRGGADESLVQLPPVPVRANTVMGFDSQGNPIAVTPMTATDVDVALAQVFPGVILDHATTSWAKIKSADYTDDHAADLANLLDMKKSVVIDTQIALNDMVPVSKARARLYFSPGGMLLAGPGMAQKSMLKVTGHHAMIVEPNMDNPAMLKSATGPRQTGINIQADHCTVRDGIFRRMLHSICTEANGEWYMSVYFNNLAYDCLGVGAGAGDTGANGYGEDRGDAFLIWGATGKMINNRAFCMEGQDARIAFHCEALGKAYLTRPYNPKRDGYDYIVSGNYAYGNFRRHFVFEAVRRGLMNNNISAGGATWWPVSITGGADLSIRNMHLYYDRPATNSAGIAWSPDRGGIMVGQGGKNIQLSDITIVFSPDAVGAGLTSLISAVPSTGVTLDRIRIIKPVGQGGLGFVADKLSDFKMTDCHVQGASIGLTTYGNQDCWIKDFSAYDITEDAVRVTGGGGSTVAHVRIEGGRLERVVNGVVATNLDSLSLRGAQFKDVSRYDIEQFGTRGEITIDGCHNENGTGKLAGLNAPFKLMEVRNIGDNPGFVYNLKYEIACITNAASALNTFGKHTGKTVIGYDGLAYISTGSAPVAPWAKVSTLTTPA